MKSFDKSFVRALRVIGKEGVNLRQPDKRKEGILGAICDPHPHLPTLRLEEKWTKS